MLTNYLLVVNVSHWFIDGEDLSLLEAACQHKAANCNAPSLQECEPAAVLWFNVTHSERKKERKRRERERDRERERKEGSR